LELGSEQWDAYLYLSRSLRELDELQRAGEALETYLEFAEEPFASDDLRAAATDLVQEEYWLTDGQASDSVTASIEEITSLASDLLPYTLFSLGFEEIDDARTIKIVLDLDTEDYDDQTLLLGSFIGIGFGAHAVARIQPPLDGGLLVVLRDLEGLELLEASASFQTAQDLMDGLIADAYYLFRRVRVRDLRRPAAQLSSADALREIGRTVEEDRGLEALEEVEFRFLTRDELREHVAEGYAEEPEEEKHADRDLLVLLGLMEPEVDLEETLVDLDTGRIAGFYDTDDKVFYVVAEEDEKLTVQEELTFAHEYTHALQDQHYGLTNIDDEQGLNDDQRMAFRSLIEGEATQVTLDYFGQHLTALEQVTVFEVEAEVQASAEDADEAPRILTIIRTFPYDAGLEFVRTVAPGGYWPAIEPVYKDLPSSTEQVMHPEKYADERDDPQAVTLPAAFSGLDDDWQELDNDVMGEFFTREFLVEQVAPDLAAIAAAGWDGDRYALLENRDDGRDLFVWKTVWDSVEEAREFVLVYRVAVGLDDEFVQTTRELRGGNRTLRWESDERSIYLNQAGATIWLLIANQPKDLDTVIPLLSED
jgi:hypothetical protein